MQRSQQLALAASLSLGVTACAGDSGSIDGEAFDSVLPASDREGWPDLQASVTDAPRSVPVVAGNLSAESRYVINAMASEMLGRLALAPARGTTGADGEDSDEGLPERDANRDDEAGADGAATESDAETLNVRRAWKDFLDAAYQSPNGSFAFGDVFIGDEAQLLRLFEALYTSHRQKGLILPSTAWPPPRALSVCWTPDSNATPAERQRVAQLVNARWAATSNVTFDFGTAPNMRTCAEVNCGFFLCPSGGEQIRIYQNSDIPRGCAAVGNQQTSATTIDCRFGVFHDYASMYLPTAASLNSNDIFVDYTAVHEFGHAMGLLHEQARSDYNYLTPGPRNCASADAEQTEPDSNPPQRVDAAVGQVENGLFDDFSIMNYCQQDENLNGGFADPRASHLSVGDILSVRAMYTAPSHSVRVEYSSWLAAVVQVTVEGTPFSVSSTVARGTLNTGISRVTGAGYTIAATALGGSRLRCFAYGRAASVFNTPQIVPPGGFTANPAISECYDPAALSMLSASFL